jgi:PAS domain S-box-containing protein
MRGDGAWDSAGNILGSAGAITNVTARKEEQLFRGDFAVLVASGMSSEEKISAVLDRACSYFGLPTAVVCHVAGDECRTLYSTGPAAPRHGSTTSVAQAIYATSFRVEGVHAFAEIANSPLADHPDRVACAAECYLGAPVFVNGARYGTICFLDSRPRLAPFQDINIAILRTIVLWLGDEIGRAQYVAEMTESDLRNSAHLASVGDAVLTLNELGCVEDSNPAAGALFGMTSEHLRGVSLLQLLPGAQALTGPDGRFTSVRGREEIVVRSDGSPVPVLMQLSEVHLSDRRIYTVALSDLTATKQAEIAKREFVSVVSHELRTPLTSICGALSLISAQTSGPLTDATIELVDIARRNGDRLVRLVNDILDVEKLETGKFEMSLGPIDLGAALTDAISANTSYAARFNVDFRLSGDVHLPYVMADANRLAQVMANLMSNAAKFTRPNTSVEIRAKANGQFARIEIQDCGHGIPDSLKPHLFEKFRQGDHSNTREREGSGLGLNISRQLVDLMHGEIGFFSEAGVGTTFYVDLPLANAAAPGGAHAHAATSTEGFSI